MLPRQWLLVSVAVLLASCGGSVGSPVTGGPDPVPPTPVHPAPPANSTQVKLPIFGRSTVGGTLIFAAYQDGNGPWTALKDAGSGYTFEVSDPKGRYGFAFVCAGDSPQLRIAQLTLAEVSAPAAYCGSYYDFQTPPKDAPTVTLSGTVIGGAGQSVGAVGYGAQAGNSAALTQFSFGRSGDGRYETQVTPGIYSVYSGSGAEDSSPGRLWIKRDVNITKPTTLDLDLAQSFDLERRTLTVKNLPGQAVSGASVRVGEQFGPDFNGGLVLSDFHQRDQFGTSEVPLNLVPSAQQWPNELHRINVSAAASANGSESVHYQTFVQQPQDVTAVLPDSVPFGFQRTAAAGVDQLSWSWEASPTSVIMLHAYDSQSPSHFNSSTVLSRGWLAEATTYKLPDFPALAGWKAEWTPQSSDTLYWDGSTGSVNRQSDYLWLQAEVIPPPDDLRAYGRTAKLAGLVWTSSSVSRVSDPQ